MNVNNHSNEPRQSWRVADPHAIVLEVVRHNPGISEAEAVALCCERVLAADASPTVQHIVQEWFLYDLRRVLRPRRPRMDASVRAAADEHLNRAVDAIIDKEVRIRLTEMVMPNGKPLGDCLPEEARHFGGWLVRVAESAEPGKPIRDSLSEEQLCKLHRPD